MSNLNRTPQQRSLLTTSLAAALHAHSQASLEEIQKLPTAVETRKFYRLPLQCQYTGVSCGSLTLPTVAGYLPLLSQWKQEQVLHPIFSFELVPLLKFAKNTWMRFCSFSPEEAEDEALTALQEQTLQITALAILHQLTAVRQDIPWMPRFQDVQNNWQSLISLGYWKAYLDSKRFTFPAVRISELEKGIDLHSYLLSCWNAKKAYETTVREIAEEAQADAAEAAMAAIRDELAGKRPTSNKMLWRWFLANLPSRYSADAEGWMSTIFFAKDMTQLSFTKADLELYEQIVVSDCPIGSTVSNAFLAVLRSKMQQLVNYSEAFEILVAPELTVAAAAGVIAVREPQPADFEKRFQYTIAHAKWKLTHGASSVHKDAAAAKQQQVTVKASFIPRLQSGTDTLDERAGDELDATGFEDLDAVAAGSVSGALAAALKIDAPW